MDKIKRFKNILTSDFIHLSHIDLDGYACQVLTNSTGSIVTNFNMDYSMLDSAIDDILKVSTEYNLKNILITDLNLTEDQYYKLKDYFKDNLVLIDHHINPDIIIENEFVDTSMCATKLLYTLYEKHLPDTHFDLDIDNIDTIVHLVDVADRYLDNDPIFEKSTIISDEVKKHILSYQEYFNNQLFGFRHPNFIKAKDLLSLPLDKLSPMDIEDKILNINRSVLDPYKPSRTLKSIIVDHIIDFSEYHVVEDKGYTFTILIDKPYANEVSRQLKKSNTSDFILSFNKGSNGVSIRQGNNKDLDCSLIAKEYFNGGGHRQAAGGSIANVDLSIFKLNSDLTFIKE